MRMHRFALPFVLAASPLAAQDATATPESTAAPSGPTQTAEGAQQFLKLITQQFKFVSSDILDSKTYARSIDIKFEPAGPCRTRATRDYEWSIALSSGGVERSTAGMDADSSFESYAATRARLYGMDAASAANDRKGQAPTLVPTDINWSSVSSVKTYKTSQYETTERGVFVASQPGFWVVAPDAPTAARIAYAMEFLRAACDQSAATGF